MNDINPIKPPIPTPLLTQTQTLFLIGFIVIGLLILLIYLYKKLTTKPEIDQEIIEEKPDYAAAAIQKLQTTKQLIDKKEYKDFDLQATKILKTYLTQEYQTNINALTTKEIQLNKQLPKTEKQNITTILTQMDKTKYAGEKSEKTQAEANYQQIHSFLIHKLS